MSKQNEEYSDIFREVKQSFRQFTNSYMTAVKNGADITKHDIIEALKERDHSEDLDTEKVVDSVKKGVLHAGEQLILFGIDFLEERNEKRHKK